MFIFSKFPIVLISSLVWLGCTSVNDTKPIPIQNDWNQSFKLHSISRNWVVPLKINGAPLMLQLDTGSARTVLHENNQTAQFFKMADGKGSVHTLDTSSKKIRTKALKKASLEIDNVKLNPIRLILLSADQSPFLPWNRDKIDGSIGFDLFNEFDVVIDKKKMEMKLFPPGSRATKGAKTIIPITLKNKQPVFEGNISIENEYLAQKARVVIDSGANIPIRIHSSDDLGKFFEKNRTTFVKTINGEKNLPIIKNVIVRDLQGNFEVSGDASIKDTNDSKTTILLGSPVFDEMIITISYHSGFIALN